jgi:type I restriction enzyme S subunit
LIDLSPSHLELVKKIFQSELPNAEIWVFGSRANRKAKPYSDLDVVVRAGKPLTELKLSSVKEKFAESNLPFVVDLVDWHAINSEFRKRIEQNTVSLF